MGLYSVAPVVFALLLSVTAASEIANITLGPAG